MIRQSYGFKMTYPNFSPKNRCQKSPQLIDYPKMTNFPGSATATRVSVWRQNSLGLSS